MPCHCYDFNFGISQSFRISSIVWNREDDRSSINIKHVFIVSIFNISTYFLLYSDIMERCRLRSANWYIPNSRGSSMIVMSIAQHIEHPVRLSAGKGSGSYVISIVSNVINRECNVDCQHCAHKSQSGQSSHIVGGRDSHIFGRQGSRIRERREKLVLYVSLKCT